MRWLKNIPFLKIPYGFSILTTTSFYPNNFVVACVRNRDYLVSLHITIYVKRFTYVEFVLIKLLMSNLHYRQFRAFMLFSWSVDITIVAPEGSFVVSPAYVTAVWFTIFVMFSFSVSRIFPFPEKFRKRGCFCSCCW